MEKIFNPGLLFSGVILLISKKVMFNWTRAMTHSALLFTYFKPIGRKSGKKKLLGLSSWTSVGGASFTAITRVPISMS